MSDIKWISLREAALRVLGTNIPTEYQLKLSNWPEIDPADAQLIEFAKAGMQGNTDVGFGIVIYTPCDAGGKNLKDAEVKPRARQNVVFEHGYLIGKLGRKNVFQLVKGDIETPNDISGVVYTALDIAGAWTIELAKEIRAAGYEVDMNKVI